MPHADFGPVKVPDGPPDHRFLFLSDVLPTAWQAVEYAAVPDGGTCPCTAGDGPAPRCGAQSPVRQAGPLLSGGQGAAKRRPRSSRQEELGLDDLVTHTAPLDRAPQMYEAFQKKQDG